MLLEKNIIKYVFVLFQRRWGQRGDRINDCVLICNHDNAKSEYENFVRFIFNQIWI